MNYLCAVDSYFPDYPGGAARVALDIALLMREYGHQVTMICKAENCKGGLLFFIFSQNLILVPNAEGSAAIPYSIHHEGIKIMSGNS